MEENVMHILFFTDNFPPEVNAPASRTFEHAREWVAAGNQVTVVTCAPNFPGGRVFPGYQNRPWQTETMDGIRVIRVWSYVTANEGFLRRVLDYASFMVTSVLASPFVGRPDIIVGTSPQLFTACAAYLASRAKRVPYVFELRDLWPESIRAVGAIKGSATLDRLEKLELFLYRKAAAIVSVTQSFKSNLAARGIDPRKIAVVTNGADLSRFRPLAKDPDLLASLGYQDKFVSAYIGTHGMAHGLETILEAARILQVAGRDDIRIFLLGDGAHKSKLRDRASAMRLGNLAFHDTVPKAEVTRYMSLLDASIIHLRRSELFKTVIPSKLFESMASGIPVLHGVEGESAEIVEREGVGILFPPEDPAALARDLQGLADNKKLRAELAVAGPLAARRYDRKLLARQMLEILEQTARQKLYQTT
jgi:glycosyltransferase involved in cell wall biosynthesis